MTQIRSTIANLKHYYVRPTKLQTLYPFTNMIGQHLELVNSEFVLIVQDNVVRGTACTLDTSMTAEEKVELERMTNFRFHQCTCHELWNE